MKNNCLIGIGCDVVALRRAERFMRSHGDDLKHFFLPQEIRNLQGCRSPAGGFALIFAAKEAVSKALGLHIAHPRQFRQFKVSLSRRRMGATYKSSGKPSRPVKIQLRPFALPHAIGVMAFVYQIR